MDAKKLNTMLEYEFCDGTTANLTLAFYLLYQLKAKNRALYDKYNKIMTGGLKDEFDMITILYAAYVCANLNEAEIMTEEEFMMKCGSDHVGVANAFKDLTTPKNSVASGKHS
jgi:hypothetical protein